MQNWSSNTYLLKKNSIYKLSQFRVQNLICRIMQLGSNYLTEYEYVKTNVQRFILIDQLVTNLSKEEKKQWNVFSNDSMEHWEKFTFLGIWKNI